jgi:small multidrug resistance family-3 protein
VSEQPVVHLPDPHLAWAVVVDRFRLDRCDLAGAAVRLLGVALIVYTSRGGPG